MLPTCNVRDRVAGAHAKLKGALGAAEFRKRNRADSRQRWAAAAGDLT